MLIENVKAKIQTEIMQIEKRTDISDDEKRSKIIHIFSVTCAALAVQPIPFADYFILTPIQGFMGGLQTTFPYSGSGRSKPSNNEPHHVTPKWYLGDLLKKNIKLSGLLGLTWLSNPTSIFSCYNSISLSPRYSFDL